MSRWPVVLLTLISCAESRTQVPPQAGGNAPAEPSLAKHEAADAKPAAVAPVAAGPKLAESPAINLLSNRFRLHLYRGPALVVTLASEGLRKYTQEYSQPWGAVIDHDGRAGRVLSNRSAMLRIPWEKVEDVTIVADVAGLAAGQRIEARVNGKRVGVASAEAGWGQLEIGSAEMRAGENEVQLYVSKAGSAGSTKSYALWSHLIIAPKGAPLPMVKSLDPLVADGNALGGFTRYRLYTEIPTDSWFVFGVAAEKMSTWTVAATTAESGKRTEIYSGAPSTDPVAIELDDSLTGTLAVVDLETPSELAYWVSPRIALPEAQSFPKKTYSNAVVFVVDALRSDKLKLYDPKTRVATPTITRLGEEYGVVLLNNQAASPSSPPSHGSIQTGMIPRVHGVVGDSAKLNPKTPMLSTQARAAGIEAAYYGNNPFGMGRLEAPGNWTEFHQPGKEGKSLDCTDLIDGMLDFATRQHKAGKRFVISSLPYEPHTPYRYHEGLTDKYYDGPYGPPVGKSVDGTLLGGLSAGKVTLTDAQWKQLRALYDGEVEYFDGCFKTFMDGLETLGIADETAVIITSDHGEGMFEHGKMGHAFGHYAELANVPFVILARGLLPEPQKITTVTSHLDLTPTVLDLLGVEADERVQGRSVLPIVRRQGPWTPRVVSLEYGRSYGLRSTRYKLVVDYQQNEEVFDLATDPTEQDNLLDKAPMITRYLRENAGIFLAHRSSWRARSHGDFNNETSSPSPTH